MKGPFLSGAFLIPVGNLKKFNLGPVTKEKKGAYHGSKGGE